MIDFSNLSIDMVEDFPLVLIIAVIITFILVHSCRRKTKQNSSPNYDKPLKERKLDFFELVLDELHEMGGANICCGFGLKSNRSLGYKTVRDALSCVVQRYPSLRTVITVKRKGNKDISKFLQVVDDQELIDLKQLDVCDSDWVEVWEDEVQSKFDCEEVPLWRTTLLKERYNPLTKTYHNAILFTFYHGSMDGLSVLKFAEEFVSCLDDVAKGTLNVQDKVNNDRSNMRQGVLTLLASCQPLHFRILQWLLPLSILQRLVLFCMRVNSMFDAQNPVTSKFSDAVRRTNDGVSRIRIIPRKLSSEKTEQIIKLCRKKRCTVQGALLACCHLAVASLVRDDKIDSVISFLWYCPVNVRSQCVPRIAEDNLGHYTTLLMENVKVPEISARNQNEFWRFALQCTQVVHGGIRTGRHLQSLYLLPFAHLVNPKEFVSEFLLHSKMNQPELFSPVHSLTNLGKINWEAKPEAMFLIDDVFGGSGAYRHGPTFTNHIATFDGVMTWSTSYFTGNITEHEAHRFVTLVFDNLESIIVADQS